MSVLATIESHAVPVPIVFELVADYGIQFD
jgi:hypothetical protein